MPANHQLAHSAGFSRITTNTKSFTLKSPFKLFHNIGNPALLVNTQEVLLLSPHNSKSPFVLCPISPSRHRAFSEQQLHHVLLFLSSHQTIHTDSDCCARALLTVLCVTVLLLLVLPFLLSSRIQRSSLILICISQHDRAADPSAIPQETAIVTMFFGRCVLQWAASNTLAFQIILLDEKPDNLVMLIRRRPNQSQTSSPKRWYQNAPVIIAIKKLFINIFKDLKIKVCTCAGLTQDSRTAEQ